MKRLAVIGDPHACLFEFLEVYNALCWLSIDEIWSAGDNIDRNIYNHELLSFMRAKKIKSVKGNHEESILVHAERYLKLGVLPKNPEKVQTVKQLSTEDLDYIRALPRLHVDDTLRLVLVHGGLWPKLAFHQQPDNIIRAQMIHPDKPGQTKWWTHDYYGTPEADLRKQGWKRWYELYDGEYDVIYGHSTWAQPAIHQNIGCGRTIGVDTGSCFGGSVTACVYNSNQEFFFVSAKAKKNYNPGAGRDFWEL